jgi:hypothetical protein
VCNKFTRGKDNAAGNNNKSARGTRKTMVNKMLGIKSMKHMLIFVSMLLVLSDAYSFSQRCLDVYCDTNCLNCNFATLKYEGKYARKGNIWCKEDLMFSFNSPELLKVELKTTHGKKCALDLNEFEPFFNNSYCIDSSIDRIDLIYKKRLTKEEIEFIQLESFVWTFLFAMVELINGPLNKTPRKYNYKVPVYGLLFGFTLSTSLTISHERKLIYTNYQIIR